MKIESFEVCATFKVAVNTASTLPPGAVGMGEQLQVVIAEAVRIWHDKMRGSLIVGEVAVTVTAAVPAPPAPEPPPPAPEPAPTPPPTPVQ